MKKNTILLTGSAGFIGFHVAQRLLREGVEVIGIDAINDYYSRSLKKDRNKILLKYTGYHFFEANIANRHSIGEIFKQYKIGKICNLAAQAGVRYSLDNPFAYEESNIMGFLTVLETAKKFGIRQVVYASSSSVYGNNTMPRTGFSETDSVDKPISVYGVTKRANELLAYTYHSLYDMQLTGLRFFTVYGPWGRPDMAYFKFADAITKGNPIDIYNQGKMKRDFTYIEDIVDGVYAALQNPFPYEIFNLGNSHTVKLMDFIKCLEDKIGMKAQYNLLPMQPGDLKETFANIVKARKHLGFSPKTDIADGISLFIDWYKRYYKI